MNYLVVVLASIVAFIASMLWYMIFAKQRAALSSATRHRRNEDFRKPQPDKILVEILRNVFLSLVVSFFVIHLETKNVVGAIELALLLWFGFPFILLSGSVLWENVSPKLSAIHAGDWLLKLMLITVIITTWH